MEKGKEFWMFFSPSAASIANVFPPLQPCFIYNRRRNPEGCSVSTYWEVVFLSFGYFPLYLTLELFDGSQLDTSSYICIHLNVCKPPNLFQLS